jgi:hypothetical protein
MALQDFTIKLSSELIQRLSKDGLSQDSREWESIVEAELRRRQIIREIEETMASLHEIPDDEKPSEEEIMAEIKAYRAEKRAKRENRS